MNKWEGKHIWSLRLEYNLETFEIYCMFQIIFYSSTSVSDFIEGHNISNCLVIILISLEAIANCHSSSSAPTILKMSASPELIHHWGSGPKRDTKNDLLDLSRKIEVIVFYLFLLVALKQS